MTAPVITITAEDFARWIEKLDGRIRQGTLQDVQDMHLTPLIREMRAKRDEAAKEGAGG